METRRRILMSMGGEGKARTDIKAGDILCAKADGSKCIFDAEDASGISSTAWTPIGVVVIPPSHDVYGTGEGAAMSLKYMSYNTPNDGTASLEYMCLGQRAVDTSLTNFTQVNVIDNVSNSSSDYTTSANLPSDIFTDIQCITDPIAYYRITPYAPSPYLSDGSRNEGYYTTEYAEYNVLSDFDGAENTDVLCSLATAQSDWRTASTITNTGTAGYSPAACCCWRYHTVGTNQGDWYLPAMGELGYLMVRLKTINDSISNVGGIIADTNMFFWSSSEQSTYYAYCIYTKYGNVQNESKKNQSYVRSFVRF